MSDTLPTDAALEQLREVIAILRELGNAGPRDQSFKQWRQVTMTLLQRIWPDNQGNAARFRRIPFSPPSSRADAKTIRECYERGVCEAIAYLETLVQELENGTSRLNRKLVRPVEAPLVEGLTTPLEAGSVAEPEPIAEPELGILPPGAALDEAEPSPARPASPAPESFLARRPAAMPAPAPAVPERAAEATPAAPARAATPPPAREKSRPERRSKPRLKDMLGFGDEAPPQSVEQAAAPMPPVAPAASTPPPVAPAAAAPVEASVHVPVERFEPPAPPLAREPAPPVQARRAPVERAEPPAPPVEPSDESAEWSAPVIPFPMHKVVVGRPSAPPPRESFEDDEPEEAFDFDFDLADESGPEVEAPPATLREMLDRPQAPRVAPPISASREVLAMASEVDRLGVPRDRRAIVRAALIDLGHQMESPPIHWAAMRQAMAFMLEYPQIARRVLPMLLPYLDEAA